MENLYLVSLREKNYNNKKVQLEEKRSGRFKSICIKRTISESHSLKKCGGGLSKDLDKLDGSMHLLFADTSEMV